MRPQPLALLLVAACQGGSDGPASKVYVASQAAHTIDVLDGDTLAEITTLETGVMTMPHNIQVTARGSFILATDPYMTMSGTSVLFDSLLVIDPASDQVIQRIVLDKQAMIAHVVSSPDEATAYVTGWASSKLYRIDLTTGTRLADVPLIGRNPHGLRLSDDGSRAYTADSSGAVTEIDTARGVVLRDFPLPGPAVQVAVGDGVVYATIWSPPGTARITLADGAVSVRPLPGSMRSPAQLVLLPGGERLLVAEQGEQTDPGSRLLEVDAATGAVLASHDVGLGAHGIVASADGRRAYVTGAFDHSVCEVALDGDLPAVRQDTPLGPNGITLWQRP